MQASDLLTQFEDNARKYELTARRAERDHSDAASRAMQIRNAIAQALEGIASVQIDAKASKEVADLLASRGTELALLQGKLESVEASIAIEVDAKRGIAIEIDAGEAELQAKLLEDSDYRRLDACILELSTSQTLAGAHALEIQEECKVKLQAFSGNPLYDYLVSVHFGDAGRYRGSRLTQYLDRWVAGLCNFDGNRRSEGTLQDMASAVATARKSQAEQLAGLTAQRDAMVAQFMQSKPLRSLREQLKEAEKLLKDGKKRANELHAQLDAFQSQTDSYYVQATKMMAGILSHESVEALMARAKQTPSQKDDDLVNRVRSLRSELDGLQKGLPVLEAAKVKAKQDYDQSKLIVHQVMQSGFTSSRYEYSSGLDASSLISGYMLGQISQYRLLDEVQRFQSERARPATSSSYSNYSSTSTSSRTDTESDDDSRTTWGGGGGGGDVGTGPDEFSTTESF